MKRVQKPIILFDGKCKFCNFWIALIQRQKAQHKFKYFPLQSKEGKSLKESYSIDLEYIVQIPKDKFTDYGISESGNLSLRYWYITPAVYNGEWQYYSNKDLETYSGEYYSAELDVVYSLKRRKNKLIFMVKGNPIGEVKPIMKDVISIRARQTFEFNKERTAFRLSMLGRVKNIKFVKK